jgi:tetraacyldisaccharide 4'-kinase
VEIFARSLQKSGRNVAILSRGYKKIQPPLLERMANKVTLREKRHPPLVVSDGERLLLDSAAAGDEPYMLASNLRSVMVLVDKDRVKAGRYAIRELGCDTLILDDGFQYLALKHRLDIVLVDSTNAFGNRYTLPRGILREPVKNIRRAGFIFITKCKNRGNAELKQELRKLNPDAEIAECRHCARYLQDVYTREKKELPFLTGKKVAAVSGIAAPQGFEEELRRLGADVISHKCYADHHRYTQQELIDRINKSIQRGADMIVTTEKDAVRFPKIERRDLPIYFLRVEIEMLSGAEGFEERISRICFR